MRPTSLIAATLLALATHAASPAHATADGAPDPQFGTAGVLEWPFGTGISVDVRRLRASLDGDYKLVGGLRTSPTSGQETILCSGDAAAQSLSCLEYPSVVAYEPHQDFAMGLAFQLDGTCVSAGAVTGPAADPPDRLAFLGLTQDGYANDSFGSSNGTKIVNFGGLAVATAISARRNGDLLFTGSYDHEASSPGSGMDCLVGRMSADGTLDTTFGGDGMSTVAWDFGPDADDECYDEALLHDGRVVVAGSVQRADGSHWFGVARLQTDGTLDTTFSGNGKLVLEVDGKGGSGSSQANRVAVDRLGRTVVAGTGSGGAGLQIAVARLLPSGALDPSFGAGGKMIYDLDGQTPGSIHAVSGLALLPPPSNDIVLGGSWMPDGHETGFVLLLHENGSVDESFGDRGKVFFDLDAGHNNIIGGIALQGGRILAAAGYDTMLDDASTHGGMIAVVRFYRSQIFGDDFEGGNLFLWSNRADP